MWRTCSVRRRRTNGIRTFCSFRLLYYQTTSDKLLYASFVELHVRELALPLKDVEVCKAASGLTTLVNEKQKEQRDKTSGKKKPKAAAKPALGSAKAGSKLDDFGSNADDFT
ncbi:hypothetical protein APHAL10511_007658 [Amanita phalloides]|nr:hypothetical protein APHAL10511_007658 [Amanita phalloides]